MSTMIADPPASKTGLGTGFGGGGNRPRNPEAWRKTIGGRGIPARFELLPEGEKRWDRLGISAGLQIGIIVFFLAVPLFFPDKIKTALNYQMVSIDMPVTQVPVAPPVKTVRPKPAPVQPKPEVVEQPKLNAQQPHIFMQQKVVQPEIKKVDVKAPELEVKPAFEAAKIETSQPKKPRELKNDNFSTGSAAPATVKAPLKDVQTGGFGETNGLPGKGDPNKGNIANRLGSLDLPGGPGYGNGTGGAKGIRGTVQSTGFGNGVANPPSGKGGGGAVQSSGFADESVVTQSTKKQAVSNESATTSVDILDKPRPEYTSEGRTLKLEGDVVLDVIFLADGTVQVNRVVSGLGHGLDENASKAAKQIKFKPAKRDGQAVDFPARVRIEFRLAY